MENTAEVRDLFLDVCVRRSHALSGDPLVCMRKRFMKGSGKINCSRALECRLSAIKMNCKACQNLSGKNPSLSFFRFPSDYNRCREWAERCNILHLFDRCGPTKFYKSFRICSDHFDSEYIAFDGRKKKLLKNAVPNVVKPKKKIKRIRKVLDTPQVDVDVRVSQKLLQNLCRFCAEENAELTDIFGRRGKTLELEKKIKLFPIAVHKFDKLPLKICNLCIVKISKFYDFFQNCVKADIRLKTILGIADDVTPPASEAPVKIQAVFKDDLKSNDDSQKTLESNVYLLLQSEENPDFTKKELPHELKYQLRKDETDDPVDTSFSYITSEKDVLLTKSNDVFGKKISVSTEGNTTLHRYICNVCSKTFSALEILESHWKAHSLQPDEHGRFICQNCNKLFPNKYRLNEHNRVHTGEYPFKCTICDKKFHKMSLLKQHSIVHESIKRFICSVCNLRSSRKGNLIQHLRTHFRDSKKENCKSLLNMDCIKLDNSTGFEINKTNAENNQPVNNTVKLICGKCQTQFLDLETLEQHLKTHNAPVEENCSYPDKGCSKDSGYPVDRPVLECTKRRPNTRSKRPHQRTYQCEECGVRFKRKDTLTNHMRIHTGERPFVCGYCGFAFKQKGDCLKHEKNHQKRSEELLDAENYS